VAESDRQPIEQQQRRGEQHDERQRNAVGAPPTQAMAQPSVLIADSAQAHFQELIPSTEIIDAASGGSKGCMTDSIEGLS
jgi:hypothetical protein